MVTFQDWNDYNVQNTTITTELNWGNVKVDIYQEKNYAFDAIANKSRKKITRISWAVIISYFTLSAKALLFYCTGSSI